MLIPLVKFIGRNIKIVNNSTTNKMSSDDEKSCDSSQVEVIDSNTRTYNMPRNEKDWYGCGFGCGRFFRNKSSFAKKNIDGLSHIDICDKRPEGIDTSKVSFQATKVTRCDAKRITGDKRPSNGDESCNQQHQKVQRGQSYQAKDISQDYADFLLKLHLQGK